MQRELSDDEWCKSFEYRAGRTLAKLTTSCWRIGSSLKTGQS